jgi:hypothetical protein
MDAEELAEVDQQLRSTCARHGLGWVMSQVDGLVGQGRDIFVAEESYYQGRRGYSDRYPLAADGRRPAPAGLTSVPFTATERTLLLIEAMITVFTQLPAAQASALSTLRDGFEGRASVAGSIVFADIDDGSTIVALTDIPDANYQSVVASLHALQDAVTADDRPSPPNQGTEGR